MTSEDLDSFTGVSMRGVQCMSSWSPEVPFAWCPRNLSLFFCSLPRLEGNSTKHTTNICSVASLLSFSRGPGVGSHKYLLIGWINNLRGLDYFFFAFQRCGQTHRVMSLPGSLFGSRALALIFSLVPPLTDALIWFSCVLQVAFRTKLKSIEILRWFRIHWIS